MIRFAATVKGSKPDQDSVIARDLDDDEDDEDFELTEIFVPALHQRSNSRGRVSGDRGLSIDFAGFVKDTAGSFVTLKNVEFSVTVKHRVDYNPLHRPVVSERHLLKDISLFLAPSTMTLLLGPPGCGKTTLLKFLAQRLPPGLAKGEFLISGKPPNLATHHRETAYITQEDCHLAPLTVAETLMFSANCQMPQNSSIEMKKERVEKIMQLLGIAHRADVIVGNSLMRGISGGEKRRLTIGVEVVKAPSFILMDEPTTGLDSQVAYKVMKRMRNLCTIGQTPVIAALLQPSYELYSLFDNIVIMGEGEIVYCGRNYDALPHFLKLGFRCPLEENPADFLQNVLQRPQAYSVQNSSDQTPQITSTQDFVREYKNSIHYEGVVDAIQIQEGGEGAGGGKSISQSFFDTALIKSKAEYGTSLWYQFKLCLDREIVLEKRDTTTTKARIVKALVFSLILGSLFFQLKHDQNGARHRIALLFFALISSLVSGLLALPGLIEKRATFLQQRDGKYYHTFPYLFSITITEIPIMILEVVIAASIIWWMSNINSDGASYVYFQIVCLLLSLWAMAMCRFVSAVSPNFAIANAVAPCCLCIGILFCGFLLSRANMPWWWRWIYYIDPMAYALEGTMIAGFHGTTFYCEDDQYVPSSSDPNFNVSYPNGYEGNQVCPITTGDIYLKSVDMSTDPMIKWINLIPMGVIFLITLVSTYYVMNTFSFDNPKGVAGAPTNDDPNVDQIRPDTAESALQLEEQKDPVSFVPVSLFFEDINYSVPTIDKKTRKKTSIKLLNEVNGYAEPGTLVALMGASGAGKSTLLDVLADRKTYGTSSGTITLNGRPRDRYFKQLTGYVEQQDLHIETQTVYEAIEFSAILRLPNSQYTREMKLQFANTVLNILSLTSIRDVLLWNLTMEQKKRVTIGVEMAANPSLLFLDEPTSGLDSTGAETVMAAVSRISRSGRTVVCTIHQPSRKLFSLFSHILLLKKGGEVSYFGKVGKDGEELKNYFGTLGFECAAEQNPADFVLDLSSNPVIDTARLYADSALAQRNVAYLKAHITSTDHALPPQHGGYAATFLEQLWQNMIREIKNWRRFYILIVAKASASLLVAVVLGTLFIQLDHNQAGFENRIAFLFFTVIFVALNSMSAIPIIMASRAAFYREHASGTYRAPAYLLAHDIVQFPISVVVVFLFCIPSYWLAGLNPSTIQFGTYLLFCLLFIECQEFLCQAVVSLTPSPVFALVFVTGIITLSSLFCGFLLPRSAIPDWWIWLYYLSPTSYFLEGIVSNELYGVEYHCSSNEWVEVPIEGTNFTKLACPITSGTIALNVYDFSEGNFVLDWWVLVAFTVLFQVITHFGFAFARVIKR